MGVESLDDIKEHKGKIPELREQLAALDGKIQNAKNEKKTVSEYFQIYSDSMKTDYDILLERAKAEMENMKLAEQLEREKVGKEQFQERYIGHRRKICVDCIIRFPKLFHISIRLYRQIQGCWYIPYQQVFEQTPCSFVRCGSKQG